MRLPTIFVSHGAPLLALENGVDAAFLRGLPARFAMPRALLVVSAHWQTPALRVGCASAPTTLHDFAGFPPALERVHYPAPGDAELGAEVVAALAQAGIACQIDGTRGLDHGVWVPLLHMWPQASVPVVTLSLPYGASAQALMQIGMALSALPERGVLVLGSGGYVHNLGLLQRDGDTAPAWARAFADWMDAALQAGARAPLANWRQMAPYALQAHPSDEHLAPLFVALGAGGVDAQATKLHEGWRYGTLAMNAFAFG